MTFYDLVNAVKQRAWSVILVSWNRSNKALLDTTPALSEEVIAAENSANLSALDSQWERRKKELLVQKAAARLKKDSKREQVEKAKLKKLTTANDSSLMAGIKTINKDQEQHLQKKFNLQVAEDYSGSDDEDLSNADLVTQLAAAQEETKKSQRLTAQLQKQLKQRPTAAIKKGTPKKHKPKKPKKQKVTPKKEQPKKKNKAVSKNGQARSSPRGRGKGGKGR